MGLLPNPPLPENPNPLLPKLELVYIAFQNLKIKNFELRIFIFFARISRYLFFNMSSFWECAGLSLTAGGGGVNCLMFTVASERNFYSTVVLLISILCNLYSLWSVCTRPRAILLLWNIVLWQITNVLIFALLIYLDGTIGRFQMHLFLVHTVLEWFVSITMEIHAMGRYNFSTWRGIGIGIVAAYIIIHSVWVAVDDQLIRAAHFGLGGYILDTVGFVFSCKFAYDLYPHPLGVASLGAFGGHAFAIIGSLLGCMIHPVVNRICLYGFTLLQNISSTMAIHHLTMQTKNKVD